MAAMLKLATLAILSCMVIVAPRTSFADFLAYDDGDTFMFACRDFISSGNKCALDYACCTQINKIAKKVNKFSSQDEKTYACLSMKAALYSLDEYNYNNTAVMVSQCGASLPFSVSRSGSCF
ncbi:hypothetical protein Droror1_Dr00009008 [Drosera rotundifolia]